MRVLVACEYSGRVRDAFIRLGHTALSCDLLPSDTPGPHYQGDVRDIIGRPGEWDLMIAHPPCTYLCRAGQHWLYRPDDGRPGKLKGRPRALAVLEAVSFFDELLTEQSVRARLRTARGAAHPDRHDGDQTLWDQVEAAAQVLRVSS